MRTGQKQAFEREKVSGPPAAAVIGNIMRSVSNMMGNVINPKEREMATENRSRTRILAPLARGGIAVHSRVVLRLVRLGRRP